MPTANVEAYRAMSLVAGRLWREHGALEYRECIADDVKPGEVTSFPQSVHLKDDEVVFLSWIVFASREARDAINARVMADPRFAPIMDPATTPFDGRRMFYGGFEVFVDV